jgi:bifunctional oligoribonuclease and PAP phosphatase NrnA
LENLVRHILSAKTIILSTHRQCDGDGLGAELGLYHALKAIGKEVQVINVDATPKKYRFLNPDSIIQYFEGNQDLPSSVDLVLIFDTNDERLLEPLYSPLKKIAKMIAFVDHHPILVKGPYPSQESLINTLAASTGELVFQLIKMLKIPIDQNIATCIYTSITFDTQLFRFIRNSSNSHKIVAELMEQPIDVAMIHKSLFGNQTVQKMAFLAKTLGQIEYYSEGRLAVLKLRDEDLFHYNLEPDDSRDVIDMLMNIETLETAALFRQDSENEFKLSLRSKGLIEVVAVAESMGGGGHLFAAGASIRGDYESMKNQVIDQLSKLLNQKKKKTGT